MISRIINRELGVSPFYRRNTNWILAAAGAAASVASSIFGGISASKRRKEAKRAQERRERQEQAWYDRRYNQDYLDTAAGQNLMRQANEYADNQWRKAEGAKAVGGGTDAAAAQAKESANRMVGNTIGNIAANDEQKKSNIDSMHQQSQQNFANMEAQRHEQQAQDITQAAQGASNAMMSAAALADGAAQKKVNTTSLKPDGTVKNIPITDNNGNTYTPQKTDLKGALGDIDGNEREKLWWAAYQ